MRTRGAVVTPSGELQMRAGAREREEHAVIPVVIAEPADLGEAEAVAVEGDNLVQALGMTSNAKVHG